MTTTRGELMPLRYTKTLPLDTPYGEVFLAAMEEVRQQMTLLVEADGDPETTADDVTVDSVGSYKEVILTGHLFSEPVTYYAHPDLVPENPDPQAIYLFQRPGDPS